MRRAISPAERRLAQAALESAGLGELAAQLLDEPRSRESKAQRRRRLRAALIERDRICTAGPGLGPHSGGLEWDHNWGRGKAPETIENGRILCNGHHHAKHDSEPSRLAWLKDIRRHVSKHGYAAEVDKCDRAIALELAQHPGAKP